MKATAASPAVDLDYIQFGFNVANGTTVNLNSLSIATQSSGTGPGTLGLYTSLDGFTNSLFTFLQQPGGNPVDSVIDLSSLGPITGPFSVRIIQIGNNAANGGTTGNAGTFRVADYFNNGTFFDIQFEGTTATVPEPSTFLIAAMFIAVALGVHLRRRSQRAFA